MREGLSIITIRDGCRKRSPTGWVAYVGWLRRASGDEWELLPGARSVWRTGEAMPLLDQLAMHGLDDDHRVSDPQAGIGIHRLLIHYYLPANEAAWAAHCPRPPRWTKGAGEEG